MIASLVKKKNGFDYFPFVVKFDINLSTLYNKIMKKIKQESFNQPLTLQILTDYNQKVFLPELKECFTTKNEFSDFKDKIMTNFDKVLKKLDILVTEKEVKRYQREKDKQLWLIVIKALKDHDILDSKHLQKIAELGIF